MKNTTMKSALFAAALLCGVGMVMAQEELSRTETVLKFEDVITNINDLYVDEVDAVKLTNDAIRKMLEELDPHSTFIPKEEVEEANQSINGSFVGVGIRFQILKDTLVIVQTIPGGPSEKVGLLAGDKIITIQEENIAGVGLKNSGVRDRLLGDKGSKVAVEVLRRNSNKPLAFTITRDKIPVHSVDASYMVRPEIGYIKLNAFSRTTIMEMEESIRNLKDQGMKKLILDLQGNGGGLLYAAQILADEFLSGDKLVVYSEGRARPRQDYKAGATKQFEKGDLIILTDEYSASASEIVSGAIQDWDRGMIVGRRTYGKGLVQQPIELSDGSQMRLTVARYYTPSGRSVQKPYDNVEDYRKDLLNRYESGEFQSRDSIHLPDSLKYTTLVKKRTVYGGGGIMPDVFVPLDTTEITDYYSAISRSGAINSFTLDYVDQHRKELATAYPDFKSFKNEEITTKKFMDEFMDYVAKENKDLEHNEEEYKISESLLKLRLKASMAQTLWGYAEFYEIYNDSNEILQKAIEILENGEYKLASLD